MSTLILLFNIVVEVLVKAIRQQKEIRGIPIGEGASQIAKLVKNPPAMQETLLRFLDWEDPLEKG